MKYLALPSFSGAKDAESRAPRLSVVLPEGVRLEIRF